NGSITFQVEIDAGLADNTAVANTANAFFVDVNGAYGNRVFGTDSYLVNSKVDLDFTGQRIASAPPGTTLTFTNVLTNRGEATDTFDVLLGASNFPTGTTIH